MRQMKQGWGKANKEADEQTGILADGGTEQAGE